MHRISLADGDILYGEGEPPDTAYLILSGDIAMHRGGVDLGAGKGAVIGLSALVGRPYASTARAVGGCDLLAFSRRELQAMIRSDPDRALPIIDAIIDLVAKINAMVEHSAS
jgi:CRP-like cAMP-binding protein